MPCCKKRQKLPKDSGEAIPGHWEVCLHCAAALIINDDMTRRVATDEEVKALTPVGQARLDSVQAAVRKARSA